MDSSTHLIEWDFSDPPKYQSLWFEKFNFHEWRYYIHRNWHYPLYASAIYLFVIFSIQKYMKDRKPFTLRGPLALWNLSLSLFSLMGFIRVLPEFVDIVSRENGLHNSLCKREEVTEITAFWCLCFTLSKYVELGDTLFIVLRKQPLIFLQWYHHITSMCLAWIVIPYAEPVARWYGLMNYGIHFPMYFYFFLKAMKVRIPRKISMTITLLQLLQMVIGVAINFYTLYITGKGVKCARNDVTLRWISCIYGSFMYLFAHFMYTSYFMKPKAKSV